MISHIQFLVGFFSELPAATKNVAIRVVTVMLQAGKTKTMSSTLLQCSAE